MAQFPVSMVSGAVPSEIPYGRASAAAYAAPSLAVGNMGEALGSISDQMVEAERKVQAARDTLKMNEVLATFRSEGDILAESPNTSLSAQENRLNHAKVMAPRLTELIKAAGITDPTLERTLRAHAVGTLSHQGVVMWKNTSTKQVLEIDQNARAQLAALERQGTPEATQEALDFIAGLTAGGVWDGRTAEILKERVIQGGINNATARGLLTDPRAELIKMDLKQGIYQYADDAELNRVRNAAVTAIHQRMAEEEKEQKKREKAAEEDRKALVDEYDSRAAAGTLTLNEVESARKARILIGEDYRRVLKSIQEPKTGPSDPDLLATYLLDAESVSPKHTAAEIDKAYYAFANGNPGLNLKDAADIKSKLRARADHKLSKGETDIGRRHGQAEQQLRANLGITGLLEAITQDQKKSYSMALGELTRRSSYFDGEEDPIAVVEDISPRYQAVIRSDFDMSVGKKRKTLSNDNPTESVESNMKRLEKDYKAGKVPKSVYDNDKRIWLEIDRDTRDLMKGSNATAPGLTGNTRGTK
jgi:hypothetical protein